MNKMSNRELVVGLTAKILLVALFAWCATYASRGLGHPVGFWTWFSLGAALKTLRSLF